MTHFLRSDIIINLLLQSLSYAFGRDGLEVGRGEDIVDDGAVGRFLLRGHCLQMMSVDAVGSRVFMSCEASLQFKWEWMTSRTRCSHVEHAQASNAMRESVYELPALFAYSDVCAQANNGK